MENSLGKHTSYVGVWNEPDPAVRRRTIEAPWAPDGANFTKSNELSGYEALEAISTTT